MAADRPLTEVLAELGFDSTQTAALARRVLEDQRLTRPGKVNIAVTKLEQVREALEAVFFVSCGAEDCQIEIAPHQQPVTCEVRSACWVCGGSSNRRALLQAQQAFASQGICRIVVVGGSPSSHDILRNNKPKEWELRLINGSERRTQDDAHADLLWADLVLIWGGTQLKHKVSELYTKDIASREKVVRLAKRSVEELFSAAVEHCRAHPRKSSGRKQRSRR